MCMMFSGQCGVDTKKNCASIRKSFAKVMTHFLFGVFASKTVKAFLENKIQLIVFVWFCLCLCLTWTNFDDDSTNTERGKAKQTKPYAKQVQNSTKWDLRNTWSFCDRYFCTLANRWRCHQTGLVQWFIASFISNSQSCKDTISLPVRHPVVEFTDAIK